MGEALIEGKSRQTATLPYLGSKKALGPRVARFERGKNAADQIVQFRAIGARNGPTRRAIIPASEMVFPYR
jgi:hypothetical protein